MYHGTPKIPWYCQCTTVLRKYRGILYRGIFYVTFHGTFSFWLRQLLDPAEYNTRLNLQINNIILDRYTHPTILGLNLDPKLTYDKHIDNTVVKASKIISSTKWANTWRHLSQHTKP